MSLVTILATLTPKQRGTYMGLAEPDRAEIAKMAKAERGKALDMLADALPAAESTPATVTRYAPASEPIVKVGDRVILSGLGVEHGVAGKTLTVTVPDISQTLGYASTGKTLTVAKMGGIVAQLANGRQIRANVNVYVTLPKSEQIEPAPEAKRDSTPTGPMDGVPTVG